MAWQDLDGAEVVFRRSAAESARFGLDIARLTIGENVPDLGAAVDTAQATLLRSAADIVVVRYPSEAMCVPASLQLPGHDVLAAGALMYWESHVSPDDAMNGAREVPRLVVRPASDSPRSGQRDSTRDVVTSIVTDSFANYGNHYSANPLLDQQAALDGYVEWALQSLSRPAADVQVLWVEEAPVGLATVQSDMSGRDLEILLAGLVPSAQGKGWYGHLLAAVQREGARRGVERVVISTQGHNVHAQRAWSRAGFLPFASTETLHVVRSELLAAHLDVRTSQQSVG